jgi:hypothetical protein
VIERHPTSPIVLFLAALPGRWKAYALKAMRQDSRYVTLRISSNEFFPVVATVWPIGLAAELAYWAEHSPYKLAGREPRSDDAMTAKFLVKRKQDIVITVPSLVQHPDLVPSIKGRDNRAWGKDRGRVALLMAEDGLAYNW